MARHGRSLPTPHRSANPALYAPPVPPGLIYVPAKARRHPRRVPRHRAVANWAPLYIAPPVHFVPQTRTRHRPPVVVRRIRPKMPSLVPGTVGVLDFLQYPQGAVTQYTPTFSSYHSDYAAFVVVLKPVI